MMESTKTSASVSVLIADGDPLICRALARLLGNSTDVEVIATSADRNEALELVDRLHPAVALVDAHMALPDGIPATDGLRGQTRATQIIILGVYEALRAEALQAGACRFLLKDGSRAALVEAIQLAAGGQCERAFDNTGERDSPGSVSVATKGLHGPPEPRQTQGRQI